MSCDVVMLLMLCSVGLQYNICKYVYNVFVHIKYLCNVAHTDAYLCLHPKVVHLYVNVQSN